MGECGFPHQMTQAEIDRERIAIVKTSLINWYQSVYAYVSYDIDGSIYVYDENGKELLSIDLDKLSEHVVREIWKS